MFIIHIILVAKCEVLPDVPGEGLRILRPDPNTTLIPFGANVSIECNDIGRENKQTPFGFFRQCVYDPRQGSNDYRLSGAPPTCPRIDCGEPPETFGAEYGIIPDTRYKASFFFGCQPSFRLAGMSSRNDNIVRCQETGEWDFGDLRCEGPTCEDPGRPADGIQLASSYEQGSEIFFECTRPGYIPITNIPISCQREPECSVIKPLGIASGLIPDEAINATSERSNYEAANVRLGSTTGWCAQSDAFSFVTVDLGKISKVKVILVKGVVTTDVVGRPTEIRFFYKLQEEDSYVVYFPNFNLTSRDPGNYGELAMITLPFAVEARFVVLGIVSYDKNPCLKFELMGCAAEEEEEADIPLLGYDNGYPVCVGKFFFVRLCLFRTIMLLYIDTFSRILFGVHSVF